MSQNNSPNAPMVHVQEKPVLRKEMMCGGLTTARPASDEIQGIVDNLKTNIHEQLGSTPSQLKVHSYRSQVVNGTNYWIKVETGPEEGKFVHLRVHQPIGGDPQLIRLQANKSVQDEIGSF